MGKSSSVLESATFGLFKFIGRCVQMLPARAACLLGSVCGAFLYFFDRKHRLEVYQNLKTSFGLNASNQQIYQWAWKFFINLGQGVIEFLRMPKINPDFIREFVTVENQEIVDQALARGKGLILMTVHSGNWELPSPTIRLFGHPCSVIYKEQRKTRAFNKLIYQYRQKAYTACGGIHMFERGVGARQLIEALRRNEIVGMVVDQGGKEGDPVSFFGKETRFSAGGVRLALATGAAICIGVIRRENGIQHRLIVDPQVIECSLTGDKKKDVRRGLEAIAAGFERLISERPYEYMWMYKVWKFDGRKKVLVLNDGRVGHLRQSQSVAGTFVRELSAHGHETSVREVSVVYRSAFCKSVLSLAALMIRILSHRMVNRCLNWGLKPESAEAVLKDKVNYVISCGSYCSAVNVLLAKEHQAVNIGILKQGILSRKCFSLTVLPQHDNPRAARRGEQVIVTKGAPNLINPEYLKEQGDGLLKRFSHLKVRNKLKIGVLIGGDTRNYVLNDQLMRIVVAQVRDAAQALDADILLTTSRRTSSKVEQILMRELKKDPRCPLLIIANRENVDEAVGGILGLSDILVVSGDSISMVSEAAASGKRLVVFPVQRRAVLSRDEHKHNKFMDLLTQEGFILSSGAHTIGKSIHDLAKNKICLQTLDDSEVIRQRIKRFV